MQHGGKVQGNCQTGGVRQGLGQGKLQVQFLLEVLRSVRQGLQHFQALAEVGDRFGVGRTLDGALASFLPEKTCLCRLCQCIMHTPQLIG